MFLPRSGVANGLLVGALTAALLSVGGADALASSPAPSTTARRAPVTTIARRLAAGTRNVDATRLAEVRAIDARSSGDPQRLGDALKEFGYQLIVAERSAEAVAPLREAESLYEKLRDDDGTAGALQMLGWAQLNSGDYRSAAATLKRAVSVREKLLGSPLGKQSDVVEPLQLLSEAYRNLNDHAQLVATLERLLALSDGGIKSIDRTQTEFGLGVEYIQSKRAAKAIVVLRDAVAQLEKTNSSRLGEGLQLLGWALDAAGQPAEAVGVLQRSIGVAKGTSKADMKRSVETYQLLATAARNAKDSASEIEARKQLLDLARRGATGVSVADTLDDLGLTLMLLQRFGEAVPYFKEEVSVRRSTGATPALGTALHNLGWAYSSIKNAAASIPVLQEAVKVRTAVRSPDLVLSLRFLGYSYWATNDERAIDAFGQALKVDQAGKVKSTVIAQDWLDVSSSYLFAGRYDQAIEPSRASLTAFTASGGSAEQVANAAYNLGWALSSSGRSSEAIPYLTVAVDTRAKLRSPLLADSQKMLDAAKKQAAA